MFFGFSAAEGNQGLGIFLEKFPKSRCNEAFIRTFYQLRRTLEPVPCAWYAACSGTAAATACIRKNYLARLGAPPVRSVPGYPAGLPGRILPATGSRSDRKPAGIFGRGPG